MQLIRLAATLTSVATILAGRPATAQEARGGDSLLARLIVEALAANPSLGADRALARAATARIPAAGALPDPMLSVGVMNLTLPRFAFRESDFTEVDVGEDRVAYKEMTELSDQTYVPTLVAGDEVLANFDTDQLEKFLSEHGIKP